MSKVLLSSLPTEIDVIRVALEDVFWNISSQEDHLPIVSKSYIVESGNHVNVKYGNVQVLPMPLQLSQVDLSPCSVIFWKITDIHFILHVFYIKWIF